MRGTLNKTLVHPLWQGIIPADAGNTVGDVGEQLLGGDHPRGCGEHLFSVKDIVGDLGSSPRMRGTPPSRRPPGQASGIIPADAGNTG